LGVLTRARAGCRPAAPCDKGGAAVAQAWRKLAAWLNARDAQRIKHRAFIQPTPHPPTPTSPQAIKKQAHKGLKKEQKEELETGEKILAWLAEGKDVRFNEWSVK
jgi:hypothetical protein